MVLLAVHSAARAVTPQAPMPAGFQLDGANRAAKGWHSALASPLGWLISALWLWSISGNLQASREALGMGSGGSRAPPCPKPPSSEVSGAA